jgi:hypothetical protein
VEIESLSLINGVLPPRVLALVVEWAAQYQEALLMNWNLLRDGQMAKAIDPLI